MNISILLFGLLMFGGHDNKVSPSVEWTYQNTSSETYFDKGTASHAFLRSQPMTDVKIEVMTSEKTVYGQLRYGTDDSTRIALVFQRTDDELELFADLNRDRIVTADEFVETIDLNEWEFDVKAEVSMGINPKHYSRRIHLKVRDGQMMTSTMGFLQGEVEFEGEKYAVRRTDGNGNGLLNDTHDRIWIDFNRDKTWDPLKEQFASLPVIWIGGKRYKVATNLIGDLLDFEPVIGAGTINLEVADEELAKRITKFQAVLVDKTGVYLSARKTGVKIEAPIGQYRVHSVTMTIQGEDKKWSYYFYRRNGSKEEVAWYDVKDKDAIDIDPIGKMVMKLARVDKNTKVKTGTTVNVVPQLFTGDGLLITSAHLGDFRNIQPEATTVFKGPEGKEIESKTSGFA